MLYLNSSLPQVSSGSSGEFPTCGRLNHTNYTPQRSGLRSESIKLPFPDDLEDGFRKEVADWRTDRRTAADLRSRDFEQWGVYEKHFLAQAGKLLFQCRQF